MCGQACISHNDVATHKGSVIAGLPFYNSCIDMLDNTANNKRIAKNTMFLYFRMILIMGVTLYTSRVVLDKLGVDDYGLYNVVGGVVGMLSFLNGTLSNGTSRFLTYELGTGNQSRLQDTFSTAFYVHLFLAIIILIVMETGGMWFLYNKLVIPPDRLTACVWVFQLSILTTLVAITQVPYTATIMAHEHMSVYAYISIFEAVAKLTVCYLLSIASSDRLIAYAVLITIVQFLVAMLYRIYCIRHFSESHLHKIFNKEIFKGMMGFSGWNVMANLSETLKLQGVLILINMFFAPVVAAAQAVANQVSTAMMQFVNNFRTAINPQIIKLYAAGNKDSSKRLTLQTTVYCFDLTLMLGLPAIVMMDWLMGIWLVEVPAYAVVFTQWIIVYNIISTFSAAFYIPMMAANKMRSNSIAAVVFGIGQFVVLYFLLKLGFGPMWVQYMGLMTVVIFSLFVKPFILYREVDYSFKELLACYWNCVKVLLLAGSIILPFLHLLGDGTFAAITKGIVSFGAVGFASYIFLEKQVKEKLYSFVLKKYKC